MGLLACGSGNGGDHSDPAPPLNLEPTNFNVAFERQLTEEEAGGTLAPQATAKVDSDGNVHILFYTSGQSLDTTTLPAGSDLIANPMRYLLHHIVWNPASGDSTGSEEIIDTTPPYTNDSPVEPLDQGIDNNHLIGLAFYQGHTPVVVYQGGARPQSAGGLSCNSFYQGDLMVAMPGSGGWQDYLGIQGDASIKNPLFVDGLVGVYGDVAVDAAGTIHMISQHYYESCDLHGTLFPDLLYVQQSVGDLGNFQVDMEEWVDEHNTYGAGGGTENAMGYHCKLVLDPAGQPVAFYFAAMTNGDRVIRMSQRVNGVWTAETVTEIDDDFTVGYLSPAIAPDGTMSVAFFLQCLTDDADFGDHLRYAQRDPDGQWTVSLVDYASYCGNYCTLTLDADQRPAIVYYDDRPYTDYRERHDVKLARFDGRFWNKEFADRDGQVGLFNSIWFDGQNAANICTYDQEEHKIIILREVVHTTQ